jgi:hypothetical protein
MWGMAASVWPQCDNSEAIVSMPFLSLRHRHSRACWAHYLIQVHPVRSHCSRTAGWRKEEAALCPPIACVNASLATVAKQYTHTCRICIVNSELKLLFEKVKGSNPKHNAFFVVGMLIGRSLYGQFHDCCDFDAVVLINGVDSELSNLSWKFGSTRFPCALLHIMFCSSVGSGRLFAACCFSALCRYVYILLLLCVMLSALVLQ